MEAGLVLRPQVIKEEKHKAEYNELWAKVGDGIRR
jgi:hypothetical protein